MIQLLPFNSYILHHLKTEERKMAEKKRPHSNRIASFGVLFGDGLGRFACPFSLSFFTPVTTRRSKDQDVD